VDPEPWGGAARPRGGDGDKCLQWLTARTSASKRSDLRPPGAILSPSFLVPELPAPKALYVRVSASDQSVDEQLTRLRSAAPDALEFIDRARPGEAGERRAFKELLLSIQAGKLSAVYATRLDRIGRSARGLLAFFELCDSRNVRVVVLDQDLDTLASPGRLIRSVLAAVAEFEAALAPDGARDPHDGRPVRGPPARRGRRGVRPRTKNPPRRLDPAVRAGVRPTGRRASRRSDGSPRRIPGARRERRARIPTDRTGGSGAPPRPRPGS
jgi:DNA invertase Pin-like site-specific DNA recombinase